MKQSKSKASWMLLIAVMLFIFGLGELSLGHIAFGLGEWVGVYILYRMIDWSHFSKEIVDDDPYDYDAWLDE